MQSILFVGADFEQYLRLKAILNKLTCVYSVSLPDGIRQFNQQQFCLLIHGWTYQVVRNILTNEKYIGDALLQKTYTTDCISKTVKKNQGDRPMVYVERNHPAIVSKAIFYQVREEMARRGSKRKVM